MYFSVKAFLASVYFLAATCESQATKQLRCWHCSSDTIGAEDFCGTTFDESNIPTDLLNEHNISVVRSCNNTIHSEHERAVCRKIVDEDKGKTITRRYCYYTNKSDPLDHCNMESTDKNVRRVFCEDCLTEKCNSASKLNSMFGGLFLPLMIAKVLAI